MTNYKDPKVTRVHDNNRKKSSGQWAMIAAAVIVGLLLVAWLLGMFSDGVNTTDAVDPVTNEETINDDTNTVVTPEVTE